VLHVRAASFPERERLASTAHVSDRDSARDFGPGDPGRLTWAGKGRVADSQCADFLGALTP